MRQHMPPMRYGLATLGLVVALVGGANARDDEGRQEPNPKLLIEELASPEFEARRLAQEQLQAMGLGAFDALLDAQFHPDVEVAHRARFILRSMSIEWVKESDPKDVKQILRNYGKSDPIDRRPQIESLAQLEELRGVPALCRLSNHEFDPVLSKYAALQIMQLDLTDSPTGREQVIRAIEVHTRPSQRPASKWLKEYSHWLQAPAASLPFWRQIVETERRDLEEGSPSTSREMAGLLYIWYSDALRAQSQTEESLEALRKTLDFVEANEMQVRDTAVGLIDRNAHEVLDDLTTRHGELFRNNPYLSYLHAESLRNRPRDAGETPPQEQINALVARAMELAGDRYLIHKELADYLEERGQFDWFEKESREVLSATEILDPENKNTRRNLAELLGELERFDDAAEVLKPLIAELAKDGEQNANSYFARYHLFQARSAAQKRQFAQQRVHLRAAVDADLTDSDVIIDMFRAEEADDAWRELTLSYIKSASKQFEENLKVIEADMTDVTSPEPLRLRYNQSIAMEYNQYAWLIANTTGDIDKALARSKQSLDLFPVRHYWTFQDTLARCYFAKGDFENAVKYQRKAVKQKPFAPAMRRQLALFENALKNSSDSSKEKK